MYAINHAATALLLKRRYPQIRMIWLLVAVQFVELLWVGFNWGGIEHFVVKDSVIHLGYLPWSHSILTGVVLGILAWLVADVWLRKHPLGVALLFGIISHVLLDLLMHEPDIRVTPFGETAFGLDIQSIPELTIIVETGYGVLCWWLFRGTKALLISIVVLNLVNVPFIFNLFPGVVDLFDQTPSLLPTIILFQILYTWYFIWRFGERSAVDEASSRE